MDRVMMARKALDEIVRRVAGYLDGTRNGNVETVVITDVEHDQYGVLRFGWRPESHQRISNTLFLARIKEGKIWIEEDNTDFSLSDELLKAGVRPDEIVLGFQPPEMRHHSEFAVA